MVPLIEPKRRDASARADSGSVSPYARRSPGRVVRKQRLDEVHGIHRRVTARVVVEPRVEQRTAAAGDESSRPGRARGGQQQVAPDVGLEVDREIVPALTPAHRVQQQRLEALSATVPRQPVGVDDVHVPNTRNRARQLLVPPADDEVDGRRRRACAQLRQRGQGHDEIAEPLEPQAQHLPRRRARASSPDPPRQADGPQQRVCGRDQRGIAGGSDFQLCHARRARAIVPWAPATDARAGSPLHPHSRPR